VKRLAISMSTLLMVLSLSTSFVIAGEDEQKPAKSLHQAVVDGDMNTIQTLISQGANINERNRMSWTPLHTAIRNQQKTVAEFLIDKGADINAKDNSGQTALHLAVEAGQKDIAELLIAKGADVNVIDGRGENALSLAQKKGNKEVVDLLLKHGAKEPPADWAQERIYGLTEQPQGPTLPLSPSGIRIQPDTSAVAKSDPNALANILADPNAIVARIKAFEGLDKALAQVDGRSRYEVREWLEKRADNRVDLTKAVDRQARTEIRFIRDVAVEEKAKKTTDAIDSLLSRRQEQLKTLVEDMEEEIKALRPVRTIRSRSGSRYSTRGQRYPQEHITPGQSTPYYGGTRPYREGPTERGGLVRPQSPLGTSQRPMPDTAGKNEISIDMWLQREPEGRIDLAEAVHEQVTGQIISIRKIAVGEKAKKTTAAIDGVMLDRQKRFEKLIKVLEQEVTDLRGGYGGKDYVPGQMGATGQQEPTDEYNRRRSQLRPR